jgi:hypothetical protein
MRSDITNETGASAFRPRAHLVKLLGQELISDEAMAIVELVKNAYDADATDVVVRLLNLNSCPWPLKRPR